MRLENWSAGYVLAPEVDVHVYSGDVAVIRDTLYDWLVERFGEPIRGLVGGTPYEFHPEAQLLDYTAAIPDSMASPSDAGNALLLEKPQTTHGLVL